VGTDGRQYLDLFTNIASLPLGYNHHNMVKAMRNPHVISMAINRSATNVFPPEQFIRQLKFLFPKISPYGFKNPGFVWLGSTGSEAIESAMKHCSRKRAATTFISFDGGFHGRTIGALSMTNTNPEWSRGFPTVNVKQAPFPKNDAGIEYCAKEFQKLCNTDIAGVFIEPVQSEGGDHMAHPSFFRKIRAICSMHKIPFVVDEVQTNLGTGTYWAHSHWNLHEAPDIVVFAKKMQVAGFFSKRGIQPNEESAFNSTWSGCPFRTTLLQTIIETIEKEDLFKSSSIAGNKLFCRLREMKGIKNVRNINAFGAFDLVEMDREQFIQIMELNGILFGPCGKKSVRIRPSLVLDHDTVDSVLDYLNRIVG